MKKFKFLVKYGLLKRLKRKSFIISNVVIFILLAVIINLPAIIQSFSDDDPTSFNVVVYNMTDETTLVNDLNLKLNEPYEEAVFMIEEGINQFDESSFWEDDAIDMILVFENSTVIDIYSKYPSYNQYVTSVTELLLIDYQIPGYQSPMFNENFAPDYEDPDQTELASALSSFVAVPLFFLITMATQIIGADIIEEKSSKAIETIIASVPTKTHFLSKVTSSILFVVIQGILFIAYATLSALIFRGGGSSGDLAETTNLLSMLGVLVPNWPVLLLFALAFMFVGTLFYIVFAAMLASMAVSQEDYAQFQSPIMMTLLVGFYIALFAGYINGGIVLKIASFIPLLTPIVAPVSLANGALTYLEAGIALAVNIAFLVGSLYVIAPVYRVAILNYDQTKFAKRIKGYFKKAFHKKS